ncbi:MAG: Rieske (2Fe-2S) protein [Candidatus Eiseniibacteriota bacterium]
MAQIESEPVCVLKDVRRAREMSGVRFTVRLEGIERPAFAIQRRGRFYAYLNVCRHQSRELDFGDARFFDEAADALVCCHHGARYHPESGACLGGPCAGGALTSLRLERRGDELWCLGR